MSKQNLSLLSSNARIQAPWIKVTIGKYTFGVFDKKTKQKSGHSQDFYSVYNITYPSYINSLTVTKINGQVNQYSLTLTYPIRPTDDPNFFEKVFSSVSNTRKIIFSYGDSSTPAYIYKEEEALITKISQQFNLESSAITYRVDAVSSSVVGLTGSFTFIQPKKVKPSKVIKEMFKNPTYGLQKLFTGMNEQNLDSLIAGDDLEVEISAKTNISPLDYINFLVSCMIPSYSVTSNRSDAIYILTIHDDTVYDQLYKDTSNASGPYFRVRSTSTNIQQADAYEIDIGYNTSTIVTNFSITKDENFAIYYDYNADLQPEQYTRRINSKGEWEDIYAPMFTSGNSYYKTRPEDVSWFTKVTKYPISASITIQGLLRPATLMQYIRLNVVFPGGNKHISSGLYIVTKQTDVINERGYRTTLALTRISN